MRIIAGRFRGRRLIPPGGRQTRPTSDRVREALFSSLSQHPAQPLQGGRVADLFAGTGALGFEALSRGAGHVTFVENAPAAARLIRDNAAALGVLDEISLLALDAARLPPVEQPYDLVFADPPYGKGLGKKALERAIAQGWVRDNSLVVLERAAGDDADLPEGDYDIKLRRYGKTEIIFIQNAKIQPMGV